ncbi:MAG: M20/M25/M40 family metallo-hydrolase [Gemmatimonadales bacterium]
MSRSTVRRLAWSAMATGAVAILPTALAAQRVPAEHPAVKAMLATLESENAWTLEQQRTICEIPAPPFGEAARGQELERRLRGLGYREITVDAVGNVIALRKGAGDGPRVVVSAHLDTVFPEGTNVSVTVAGTRLSGPGIGDDCRGLAVLLAVARVLSRSGVATQGDLLLVGTVGEEGPGNLRGVRHLFEARSAGRIDAFISIDGTGLGLTSRAVGSHRYKVTFSGPGGHSYGAFGMPNPMHAMGRAIAAIADLEVPASPKTVFNVGIVEGGVSVNSITSTATMQVDLRSESPTELGKLDDAFQRAVQKAVEAERRRWPGSQEGLDVAVEDIGKRPAAAPADTAAIVRTAQAAARALGLPSPETSASSTDANIAMSPGCPPSRSTAVAKGWGPLLGEWYDDGSEAIVARRALDRARSGWVQRVSEGAPGPGRVPGPDARCYRASRPDDRPSTG